MISEDYGTWDPQNRLTDLRSSHILSRRRLNIRQSPMASSLVIRNEDTVNHLYDYQDRHVDSITKFTFQIIDITMRVMNASKTYHYVPIWGYLNQTTQKYSGMMGDLVDGVSDIGGT
jgi:glutamate receptor, ionotropic, invertebrate